MPSPQQRVVITGASSGLGAALARHYAGQGAVLGLVARRRDELDRLAQELKVETLVYAADVRDASALQAAAADFVNRCGCPDIVIANAGISIGTVTEFAEDIDVFQRVIDTNVLGMAKTFQPFIKPMRVAVQGKLVGIASVAGYRGLPGAEAYSSSKAAAISYLESLRVELRNSGIKVVTICPGFVATPMTAKNPYRMPFIISAERAAYQIAQTIASGSTYAVIPWQMAIVAKLLRLLPNCLYDRLFANRPQKPRRTDSGETS